MIDWRWDYLPGPDETGEATAPHRRARLVWRDDLPGATATPSDLIAAQACGGDGRRTDVNTAWFATLLCVEPVADLGILRTLPEDGDGDGHFRYPRRAWREARPILALLCLIVGLLLTLASCAAGPVLLGAGAAWLIGASL